MYVFNSNLSDLIIIYKYKIINIFYVYDNVDGILTAVATNATLVLNYDSVFFYSTANVKISKSTNW